MKRVTDFLLKSSKAFRIIGNVEGTLVTKHTSLADAKTKHLQQVVNLSWIFFYSSLIDEEFS